MQHVPCRPTSGHILVAITARVIPTTEVSQQGAEISRRGQRRRRGVYVEQKEDGCVYYQSYVHDRQTDEVDSITSYIQ